MAGGKFRPDLVIVFWGRLLSKRTHRHTVVRQADSYRQKKDRGFSLWKSGKLIRISYVSP